MSIVGYLDMSCSVEIVPREDGRDFRRFMAIKVHTK